MPAAVDSHHTKATIKCGRRPRLSAVNNSTESELTEPAACRMSSIETPNDDPLMVRREDDITKQMFNAIIQTNVQQLYSVNGMSGTQAAAWSRHGQGCWRPKQSLKSVSTIRAAACLTCCIQYVLHRAPDQVPQLTQRLAAQHLEALRHLVAALLLANGHRQEQLVSGNCLLSKGKSTIQNIHFKVFYKRHKHKKIK